MAEQTIPILDLGPYLRGEPSAFDAAAERLRHINETIGFLFIVNHGVPRSLVDQTFAWAARFHDQPIEKKLSNKINAAMQGYMGLRASTTRTSALNLNNRPNENEAFFIKRSGDDIGPASRAANRSTCATRRSARRPARRSTSTPAPRAPSDCWRKPATTTSRSRFSMPRPPPS